MKKPFNPSLFELQVLTFLTAEEKSLEDIKEISPAGCLPLIEITALLNAESAAKLSLIQVADPILYKKTKLKTTQYNYLLFEKECRGKGLYYSDVAQGKLRDCWFLAALGAILLHPQGAIFIASMMRDLSQLIEIETHAETKKIVSARLLLNSTKPKIGAKLSSIYKKIISLGALLGLPEGILVRLFKDNLPHYVIVKKSTIPEIYNYSNFYVKILEKAYLNLFSSLGDFSYLEGGMPANAFQAFSATSYQRRDIFVDPSVEMRLINSKSVQEKAIKELEKDLEKVVALVSPADINDPSLLKGLRPITIRFSPTKIKEYNSQRPKDPELKLVAQHTYFMSHLATLVAKSDGSSRTVVFLINPWNHSGVEEIFDEKTKEFTLVNSADRVSMMSLASLLELGSYITIANDFEISHAFTENLSKKSIKHLHSLLRPASIPKSDVSIEPHYSGPQNKI